MNANQFDPFLSKFHIKILIWYFNEHNSSLYGLSRDMFGKYGKMNYEKFMNDFVWRDQFSYYQIFCRGDSILIDFHDSRSKFRLQDLRMQKSRLRRAKTVSTQYTQILLQFHFMQYLDSNSLASLVRIFESRFWAGRDFCSQILFFPWIIAFFDEMNVILVQLVVVFFHFYSWNPEFYLKQCHFVEIIHWSKWTPTAFWHYLFSLFNFKSEIRCHQVEWAVSFMT